MRHGESAHRSQPLQEVHKVAAAQPDSTPQKVEVDGDLSATSIHNALQVGVIHGGVHVHPATDHSVPPVVPFEVRWTGNEPVASYSHMTEHAPWWTLAVWSGIYATVACAGIVVPLVVDPASFSLDVVRHRDFRWVGFFACLFPLAAATCGHSAVVARLAARLPDWRPWWSLHVGPNYIVTTSPAGRCEFTWDQVRRVTISEIRSWSPDRFTAIFLEFNRGARPARTVPAGWPYPPSVIIGSKGTRAPVCVLGPLTEVQRTHLRAAISAYAGRR
jgi:hypothetical protein